MKEKSNYCYYLVAFIDILGQKEAFQGINGLPKNDEENKKLINAHSQTVEFVEDLREWFDDFFNAYTEERKSEEKVPKEKQKQFDEMRKSVLKTARFSDCIQAFVSLESHRYHSPCINGIFGILGACGGMMVLSLARKKPFRAGIDVGIGTELSTGEVYGPGFFNAYKLESKIAQYPRIVIGDELINYLMNLSKKSQQFPGQTKEDIGLCKIMADNCLKMVVKDIDGHNILDYLGDIFLENFIKNLDHEGKVSTIEAFKMAFDFIENEYKERKKNRDSKLAPRYFMLYSYFKCRQMKMQEILGR